MRCMAQYYVDIFITNTDLSGASAYLKGTDIENLADAFDSTDYDHSRAARNWDAALAVNSVSGHH